MSFFWILVFLAVIFGAYFIMEYVVDAVITWPFEE